MLKPCRLLLNTSTNFQSVYSSLNCIKKCFSSTQHLYKSDELFPQRLTLPENHGYIPVLSPNQVTAILTNNQATHHYPTGGPVSRFDSSQLASNSPIEDRRAVGRLIQTGGLLFGVFDGHGGAACAQATSERLLDYIAVSLLPPNLLEQYSQSLKSLKPMQLLELYRFHNDYINDDLADLYQQSLQRYVVEQLSTQGEEDEGDAIANSIIGYLKSAFIRLDNDISHEAKPHHGKINEDTLSISLSGSCCCTVHILGKSVHVANIGDCRAVVGSLEGNKWKATMLTEDHNVENKKESKRLFDSHPEGEWNTLVRNGRLLSQLIPLRAFGDVKFKWSVSELKNLISLMGNSLYSKSILPHHYYTPPYLIARPEVKSYELSPSDHFMIIASDGLWELLSTETAINIVGEHLKGKQATHQTICKETLNLGQIDKLLQERRRGEVYRSTDANGAVHLLRHALGYQHRKVCYCYDCCCFCSHYFYYY